MERKGEVFAGGRFGSDDPFFATILFDTDCAIVDVWSLSTLPPLASPPVEIACLCLRCDEERASSGNLEDRETDITDYLHVLCTVLGRSTTMQNESPRCFCMGNISILHAR